MCSGRILKVWRGELCDFPRQNAWAEEALKLVAADPSVMEKRNYKKMTPLMLACAQGYRRRKKPQRLQYASKISYVRRSFFPNVRTYMRVYLQRAYMRA